MTTLGRWPRFGIMAAFSLLAVSLTGCRGRMAAKAPKAVAQFAKDRAGDAVQYGLEKLLEHEREQSRQESQSRLHELLRQETERRHGSRATRFPYPVSSVQPLAGAELEEDPATGLYIVPNNYGGHSIYQRDGTLVGFTALHRPSRAIHHFDAAGNRR